MREWLSCPMTENGTVRILSLPKYSGFQPPHVVIESLRTLLAVGQHEHVSDDVSLLCPGIDPHHIAGSAQITDTYLALLAHRHGAQLASFDRRISAAALTVPAAIQQIDS